MSSVQNTHTPKSVVRTKRAILQDLKEGGPKEADALAKRLGISGAAVRQHLSRLKDDSLVTYTEEHRAKGRPVKLWQLTAAANDIFPDAHAELTVALLEDARNAFGSDGMEKLLTLRAQRQVREYRQQISADADLSERVKKLASIRTNEGYMAEYLRQDDETWLLIENHCSICAAAKSCQNLCAKELWVFQQVLGPGVRVERTEHIVKGGRRCVYLIK